MKKIYTVITILAFSLQSLTALADNSAATDTQNTATNTTIHYISAPRFVRPLIERWIAEYEKEVPDAHFAIAKTPAAKGNSILKVQLSDAGHEKAADLPTAYFGSYAILPFAAKNSVVAKDLAGQHLTAKKLKALYFENEDIDEADTKKSKFGPVTIYSGNSQESVSKEFAAFYGKETSHFRGKRIVGDDLFLITAITKDSRGISFNALSNLYDLTTRKLKDDLTLIALDYNKEEKTALADGSSIDTLLDVLENGKDSQIPISRIGFTYQASHTEAARFLAWILTQGQQYNHQYGIMRLDGKLVAEQVKSLPIHLTAQK